MIDETIARFDECDYLYYDSTKADQVSTKPFPCLCGKSFHSLFNLNRHMTTRNCTLNDIGQAAKRARLDESLPQPHQLIGSKLMECIDIHKSLKDKGSSDDAIK